VDGHAQHVGSDAVADFSGRPLIAQRLVGLLGPGSGSTLVPVAVEDDAGLVVFVHGQVRAIMLLEHDGRVIHHMRAFVFGPGDAPRA
jgi:hypothetical protein